MVHFIYGPCGSGKTTALYKYLESDIKQGKNAFFIVPEQETVAVERVISTLFPPSAQLSVDVLNFSRLCNKIFRIYGGLSYNAASKPIKALLMWNTLRELSPMLEEYKAADMSDFSLTQKMLSAYSELKAYCVSPQALERACEKIDSASSSYAKLRDISLIYSAYSARLDESFADSSDDISRALNILTENNYFAGASVYFDSFAGFTKQELRLIEKIAEQCGDMYITLPITSPNDHSIHLESLRQTLRKLKRMIGTSKYDETFLDEIKRNDSLPLKHLQNNVWNFEATVFSDDAGEDIRIFECDTPYSESDTIAADISKRVQSGLRYGEIAIIARDTEKYRGILDASLEKYGVPYFMSERTDLTTKALVKFLFSALKIKHGNWKGSDVVAHLKSGYCGADPFDTDIFEDYVNTWNISGNKFLGEGWTMNPDGYSARLTPRGERILKTANKVKESVVSSLSLYFTRLDASENIKEMCGATLEFLKDSAITEKVRERCSESLTLGNKRAAEEDMKLYSLTLNILYELSTVLGEERLSFDEFRSALELMFSESDIGTIPTSADEVTVGSASMLRVANIKIAYVIGLNEGEFPASVRDNGIFTDFDKELLGELEIDLSASADVRTSEELFFLYRALCSPSQGLVLSFSSLTSDGSSQRHSIAIDRIKRLFPKLCLTKDSALPHTEKIWNLESAKDVYPQLKNYRGAQRIAELITKQSGSDAFLRALDVPLSQSSCTVSPEIAQRLFGSRLSLTQSRLEKYVLCGFDYYCTYVLGLRESKKAVFQLNDIGTFIHYILEMFMKEITADGKLNLSLSDTEIDEILKVTVSRYLIELLGENYAISNRTKHLFIRLNKLSFMIAKSLINEFRDSDFLPAHFELKVGMGDSGIDALEFKLKDGTAIILRGIADRVDVYKNEEAVYIRVVDYKTGSKEFSFDDLKDGLNTQLLIYLFSICKLENVEQRALFGCNEGERLVPAGIQYLSSNAPVVSVDKFCDGKQIEELIQNEFSRSGLISSDPDIIRAINHSLDPKIVSKIKGDDNGNFTGKSLISSEGFDEIFDMLSETIVRVAQSLKDGKADAIPLRTGEKAPCRYCKMKSICRSSVCRSKI